MKLEEASQHLTRMVRRWRSCRANGTPESTNLLRFDALEVISTHLEATRWRKLSEEKPPKPGEYEAGWMDSRGWQQLCGWWTKGGFFQYWTSYITHWRPIVGSEEEP